MGGAIGFWLLKAITIREERERSVSGKEAIAVLEGGAIGFEEEGDRSFRGRAIGMRGAAV